MSSELQVQPKRVLRVIARLNVGGPSIQAITLSRFLAARSYKTELVRGREGPREGSMDSLAEALNVRPRNLPTLQRKIGLADVASLVSLIRLIRVWQPQILHTHAAKAGALGRIAALMSGHRRPQVIIHTFHGHVLKGYFSPLFSWLFTRIERALARVSTRLIAVSSEVRDELVALGVAPPDKIVVIPLGFDLSPFQASVTERNAKREALRRELGIPMHARVVTLVGRLEPIKRVDRFLRVAALLNQLNEVWFLIVGDGELRETLQNSSEARVVAKRLVWAGLRGEMPDVYFSSEVLAVTSDNEGTAVSAIEAQAARLPVVTTLVGGMRSVVAQGETGFLVERADEAGFAEALELLLVDKQLRERMGRAGAAWARERFSLDRLVDDMDRLYTSLLETST